MTQPFAPGEAQRVVVVGTSSAGKSTLARALAAQFGHPYVELDALHWAPGWTEKPDAEFLRLAAAATAGEGWVVDGNYAVVRDCIWPRATAVVWLNYSMRVVLMRGLRRTLRRGLRREVLWHGNRESLRRTFLSKESILWWIVTTHARRNAEFTRLRASGTYPRLRWIELRHPREAEDLLRAVRAQGRMR